MRTHELWCAVVASVMLAACDDAPKNDRNVEAGKQPGVDSKQGGTSDTKTAVPDTKTDAKPDAAKPTGPRAVVVADTCTNTYPSYWQDPDPKYAEMWKGQKLSDQPPAGWKGPVFRLSDRYPSEPVDDSGAQTWRDAKYDPLFKGGIDQATKTQLASDYIWEVMRYIQEGNIDSGNVETDWTLCNNPVRNWYHMPFQTYDVLSGREFTHGLTREAPVKFTLANVDGGKTPLATTVWAVGFYNATGAHTLGKVWKDGAATMPTSNVSFDEGTVVGKLLLNTATPQQFPTLEHMPAWTANISATDFCSCKSSNKSGCTMVEQSKQCARSLDEGTVQLMQFDVAVKDSRAGATGWVFGTFVADGPHKKDEANPWNRISALGLMWGNDTPPAGGLAIQTPDDPRKNGFGEEVIFWDVVDRLNAVGGEDATKQPGHLGCNKRLNGPADNANSSCLSCHMTASVPDDDGTTPPIIAQFGGITSECVLPSTTDPTQGVDASGAAAKVIGGIGFADMDGVYFANTGCGTSVDMTAQTSLGPKNVLGDRPVYADGRKDWTSLDYSLQLSISLTQWAEWQEDQESAKARARFESVLPAR